MFAYTCTYSVRKLVHFNATVLLYYLNNSTPDVFFDSARRNVFQTMCLKRCSDERIIKFIQERFAFKCERSKARRYVFL